MSKKKLKKRVKDLEAQVADMQAEIDQTISESYKLDNQILQLENRIRHPQPLAVPPNDWKQTFPPGTVWCATDGE